ncbi:bifunctional alpha,alpha-trehalose-phosphate synthase (UDP-forming)/trehalose-phosphatase [Sphingobacterium sp. SYP-B4668]|uniref:bifunctional alpha,alpha-trehalose-phosphate synthase (UDP-forming)/trehalose-phosphatase n=1 Tax=Sphingobacterium sp. SYP-B4668 TaxID=2996035 RepID=UPI0022DD5FE8|nr:bifunctional alpha,alpha-trehalose-phosphate synthase (UDP-forming)/trehalose-phosphatase [Sphingobacterium sp. SYP-B4668]
MSKTIIVSNRLPIKIERTEQGLNILPSEGGLATGLGSIYNTGGNVWIGWPGIVPENEEEESEIRMKLKELNLIPVFLDQEELEGFYEGFSNEVIWPICHYKPSYAVYDEANWETYYRVNVKFSTLIKEQVADEDEIWIHDYQLMLLPSLVRAFKHDISIAYFQHIPFPSHEIFRLIPWRNQLLNGLLGADLVGFHTFNDAQYFIDACSHILGTKNKENSLQHGGRTVFVEAYPMGIDNLKFEGLSQTNEVRSRALGIKEDLKDRKIILSVDRLDYSKGILERIHAFENLLLEYPDYERKIVYYMLVVPSRDQVQQYKMLKDEVDRSVGRVNAKYGKQDWTPIAYFYSSYPLEELSALYVSADVCLVTPIRDGMNLVCKEYIASHPEGRGVLVLSEMAGAARELTEALIVNPNDAAGVAASLREALEMPVAEQTERMMPMLANIRKFNIHHWVRQFMERLREIKELQHHELARKVGDRVKEEMCREYGAASRRLILLDYDGTLVGFNKDAEKATPTMELYEVLNELNNDDKNLVVIISGRKHQTLESWFLGMEMTMVGEHGAWSNYPNGEWKAKKGLSTPWKEVIKDVMEKYADRTPGAFVEEKNYSLAWHYRKVQAGLGRLRAQELMDRLRYIVPTYGVQLLDGDDVIEVKNSEVNKGRAALEIWKDYNPQFVLAMGDDKTDEDMFQSLPEQSFTIKVGNKPSSARYYIEGQGEVMQLLKDMLTCKGSAHD